MADEKLSDFCGSKFWDANLTWYTTDPELTSCFEQTVLVWVPVLFLWLFLSLDLYFTLTSKSRDIPWTWKNVSKFTVNALLLVLCIVDFIYVLVRQSQDVIVHHVNIYTPVIRFLSFGMCLGLLLLHKKFGQMSSGLLCTFWFIVCIFGIPQFRTDLNQYQDGTTELPGLNVSYMILYCLCVVMFLLNIFADDPPQKADFGGVDNPCPESTSSFPSRLTYAWFDKLALLGFRRPLVSTDLWNLNKSEMTKVISPQFDHYWNKVVDRHLEKKTANAAFLKRSASVEFIPKKNQKPASILGPLCKAFGPTFLAGSSMKLIQDLLSFVSPQILNLLIGFVEDKTEPVWRGYLYALILVGTAVIQTLVLSQYFQKMFLVGLHIRTCLISAVYRKALRISSSSRKESTVGEIVNLMAVDAQRFMDLTTYLNMIWSAPLQIALALYFLWQILGPSVLAGLAVMVIMIPINGYIANKVKTLQIKQMKNKDERVKMMNEILSGIKVLKLYAWEPSFEQQVLKIRGKEIKVLKQAAYFNAATSFIWACAPYLVSVTTYSLFLWSDDKNVMSATTAFVSLTLFNIIRIPMTLLPLILIACVEVSLATFATFVLSDKNNVLDAKTAFVSLSLFNILRFPLSMLPMLIMNAIQASVSVKRINKFMNLEELDPDSVTHDSNERDPLIMENGTFCWDRDGGNTLKDISFRAKEGSLVAVVGAVGSGKSSLLSAFLGEMDKISGRVNTKGSIAYVPQLAWIQNATLKDNILFGKKLNEKNYKKIVDACALIQDIDMLPGGDQTEIGEKGINLSGGQKQRVSLARAVYYDSDVYFLDDPLSAVDSHVGKHIFENVIGPTGILKKKTRLLVTHAITYLPQVDMIIVLKDGVISEMGTYKELLDKKGAFSDFIMTHLQEASENDDAEDLDEIKQQLLESNPELQEKLARQVSRQRSVSSDTGSNQSLNRRRSSDGSQIANNLPNNGKLPSLPAIGEKLIEAEKAETGGVKWSVYKHYLKSIGPLLSTLTILLNVVFQGFSIGTNIWLSIWSSDTKIYVNETIDTSKRDMYLEVYGLLGLGQSVTSFLADFIPYVAACQAALILHAILLGSTLHLPLSFFDVTPSGRVLSRFSKDIDTIDNNLAWCMADCVYFICKVVGTLFVISYSTPIFIVVIIPIGLIYYFIQRFYVATSRQLKRLESVSRSPIYSHFGESVTGTVSIRAYNVQDRFIVESEDKVDFNQVCYYPSLIANRWLAVRLEMVGNLIIFFAGLFAVLGRNRISSGLVGLSVSYALQITQTLNWLVRMTAEVETNIVAVERIKEYGETPQEADWEIEPSQASEEWPEVGEVEFRNFTVRYREGLDLVLKGISFTIRGGEKVGIVGRTGAGKSSLTLSLFRIIEAAGGSIHIDGIEISKLGLHKLRSRLTIIPQDPVLFSGSLRMNLDPFDKHTDEQVWRALELAHLKTFVKGLTAGLQHEVSEGGDNLSVGQRQLICLARALLRKTKVLILDEATAAVDLETDDLIQKTIRSEFLHCTVLTIAHRINTIMDSDRVIVLDKGLMVEFDSPESLLKTKKSIFYGMAHDAGLA